VGALQASGAVDTAGTRTGLVDAIGTIRGVPGRLTGANVEPRRVTTSRQELGGSSGM